MYYVPCAAQGWAMMHSASSFSFAHVASFCVETAICVVPTFREFRSGFTTREICRDVWGVRAQMISVWTQLSFSTYTLMSIYFFCFLITNVFFYGCLLLSLHQHLVTPLMKCTATVSPCHCSLKTTSK